MTIINEFKYFRAQIKLFFLHNLHIKWIFYKFIGTWYIGP